MIVSYKLPRHVITKDCILLSKYVLQHILQAFVENNEMDIREQHESSQLKMNNK